MLTSCSGSSFCSNRPTADQAIKLNRPKSPEWIKRLDPFLGFLDTVSRRLKHKPSVKVAILDDGCKLNDLEGPQICESLSFRPHREEYFVGPCSHGTEMARCIRAVCPEAGLYIARLDDSRQAENQRFTIASCYKVSHRGKDYTLPLCSNREI